MAKKVAFSKKPEAATEQEADRWVSSDEPHKMKRLTIDIPEDLHRALKVGCAARGVKMADEVRRMIEAEYPVNQ